MKYLIRMLLLPCILLWLTACAILPKKGTQPKPETKPMAASGVETPRRRIGSFEDQAATEEGKGARRRPLILTDIEEVPDTKEKKEETTRKAGSEGIAKGGSVAIFEPYDPEKARQEALKEGGETLPKEIREELLGLKGEEEYVTLNFEQAPIAQILNAVSETLGMNFIMSPGVKGTITMQTSKPVPASELFQILQSVLEVNGLTLVPSGRYFKLVVGKEAKQYPIRVVSGKEGEQLPSEDTFITQIIPLDYIPVKDMQNILQPFLSKSAPPVITHDDLNILIINDFASNIKRLLKFVQELDKPLYQPKEKVYVYYVENSDADKLASTLSSIYKDKDKSKWSPFSPLTGEKDQPPTQPEPPQFVQTPFGPMVAPEQVSGDVRITADKEINALIIVTSPRNYPSVLETIKKLDIMPKQALIEALIVDVTLSDRTEFGLGWYLKGQEQTLGANMASVDLSTSVGPESFTGIFGYKLITDSRHFITFMRQLNEVTNLNVMSSPYIMAVDNQKATINITRQYPVPREREITSVTGIPQIERTYDYKEVGLKLDVTPKINENNLLTLEIKQEVSEFAEEYKDTGQGIYNKREATSKVVIMDGQTIVIGGLIQNKVSKSKTGIPFFSDIPVIGKLFGGTKDVMEKTELLIFMTPHVVTTQEEVKKLTSDFEVKVESLKKMVDEFREGTKSGDQP